MRILFIRHGDPDYTHDTLTEKGIEEAGALSRLIPAMNVGDCYASPLGRAQKTAEIALAPTGITPVTLDWIQEFMTDYDVNGSRELQQVFPDAPLMADMAAEAGAQEDPALWLSGYRSIGTLVNPDTLRRFAPDQDGQFPKYGPHVPWDMMPAYYTSHPELSDPAGWRDSFIALGGGDMPSGETSTFLACYDHVARCFDAFLEGYGYRRAEGGLYRTDHGTEKTVTFFCHFGITAVLLSRLWNTSPFLLLQSLCTAPTSVTEVVTEERAEGYAYFRALRIGDISHLVLAGQKPSFSARFCETFYSEGQRH